METQILEKLQTTEHFGAQLNLSFPTNPLKMKKSFSLENTSVELFEWFSNNQMKANPDKCHFRTSESKDLAIDVENNQIANSKCEKLLGIKIDNLTFNAHIDEICEKAGQNMNALSRVIPYMNITKRRFFLNTFFISQFNYCPLTWMCQSREKITN